MHYFSGWRRNKHRHHPKYAILFFYTKGVHKRMAFTLSVGQTATAVLVEFDAQGAVVASVAAPVYSSDNAAVALVNGNQVTAVGVGTANISGSDSGDGLSASQAIVVNDVATSASLTLTLNPSTPVSQAIKA